MLTNIKAPTIIITILLGLFIAAAWFAYNHLATQIADPLQAFPKNTAFILEIPEPQGFFESLNSENDFWLDLLPNIKIKEFNLLFNDLIERSLNDKALIQFFNQPFYLSCISSEEYTSELMLITRQGDLSMSSINTKLFSKLKEIKYSAPTNDSPFSKIQSNSLIY